MSLANALHTAAQAANILASVTDGPLAGVARILAAAAGVGAGLARAGLDTDGIVDRITAIQDHGAGEVDERTDAGIAGLPEGAPPDDVR